MYAVRCCARDRGPRSEWRRQVPVGGIGTGSVSYAALPGTPLPALSDAACFATHQIQSIRWLRLKADARASHFSPPSTTPRGLLTAVLWTLSAQQHLPVLHDRQRQVVRRAAATRTRGSTAFHETADEDAMLRVPRLISSGISRSRVR